MELLHSAYFLPHLFVKRNIYILLFKNAGFSLQSKLNCKLNQKATISFLSIVNCFFQNERTKGIIFKF
jgi:hypothetical protein